MKRAKYLAALLAVIAAALGLAACGSGGNSGGESESESVSGSFEAVAGAPAAYSEVGGEATLERVEGHTDARLKINGLEPKTEYVGHLHVGGCKQADPGGPHFQFEKGGSEMPPNEIHFEFTSDTKGEGAASASNKKEVPVGEAGSIVVHLAEGGMEEGGEMGGNEEMGHSHSHMEKIACAELEGAASGGGESASGGVKKIVVKNGEPVGGVQQLEYSAGEQIEFTVESDVASEVHVHGYDLMKDVKAGGSVSYSFPAEIEGIFEVELEETKEQIAEIRVNP